MNAMQIGPRKGRRRSMMFAAIALLGMAGMSVGAAMQQNRQEGVGRPVGPPRTPNMQARQDLPDREPAPLLGRRVAVLVGEGAHDLETLVPIGYLTNRGARVHVLGIEPGMVRTHNGETTIRVERAAADQRPIQFDALVIPGGKSPETLRQNPEMVTFVKEFFESGRPVAAICHGPQLLITAGVMGGKTATCYPEVSSEMQSAGANYVDEKVVRDGNLITSRVPEDLTAFCEALEKAILESPGMGGDRPRRMRPDRGRDRPDPQNRDDDDRPGRGGDNPTGNQRPR